MLILWSSLGPTPGTEVYGRKSCPVGTVIEDYYKLKMADHSAAIKALNWPSESPFPQENEHIAATKADMIKASQALLAHWQSCEDCKRQPVSETAASI